ncbi:hypothetical protein F0562_020166 [Nyssa sinensis]|uniref:DYW domain-containing protein n=1 Tax=Nyssa sinensis TaxID=561372 RepID=A0A5J5BUX9_9ASTE|nr:hypothetical protein F0562_020166 [Nyssa sinensis]
MHKFIVGDRSHEQSDDIYRILAELRKRMRVAGYMADKSCVLRDVEEEEKEEMVGTHSEKLAIAFSLLVSETGAVIRVVKNLRMLKDYCTRIPARWAHVMHVQRAVVMVGALKMVFCGLQRFDVWRYSTAFEIFQYVINVVLVQGLPWAWVFSVARWHTWRSSLITRLLIFLRLPEGSGWYFHLFLEEKSLDPS